jgi:hypothetical protein
MAYTPHDPATGSPTTDPTTVKQNGYSYAGDDRDEPATSADGPRLVEEHHIRGPYGEDELEATDDRGRSWYHLRPEPRRRADLFGFNYTWWLMMWILFIFIVFLPWGHGWGY